MVNRKNDAECHMLLFLTDKGIIEPIKGQLQNAAMKLYALRGKKFEQIIQRACSGGCKK